MYLAKQPLQFGSRPALIVIDVMQGFTDSNCALGSNADEVVSAISRLIRLFRDLSFPIVFTKVVYRNENEAKVFRSMVPALDELKIESKWHQFDSRLDIADNDIIVEKKWASCFFKTNLPEQLEQHRVDSLVMCGLSTSGCVRASAVDGLQWDYPVYVVEEACGDRDQDAHRANLFDFNAKYGEVIALNKLISML